VIHVTSFGGLRIAECVCRCRNSAKQGSLGINRLERESVRLQLNVPKFPSEDLGWPAFLLRGTSIFRCLCWAERGS
jgi:hypothetical protein